MNGCFTMGGGGGSEKIRAVSAATYDMLPDNAKDGTIGIISETKAGTVWAMNTEPQNAKEGDVWMMVTEESNSPISLKRITLYPRRFLQLVNGTWMAVAGYVRYQGVWVAPVLWLYSEGNQYAGASGGWTPATDGGNYMADVVYRGKTTMRLYAHTSSSGGKTHAAVCTAVKIPAGVYSKLFVRLWRDDDNGDVQIGFSDSIEAKAPTKIPYRVGFRSESEYSLIEVDLSSLEAAYSGYLTIYVGSPMNNQAEIVYVSDVYMTN